MTLPATGVQFSFGDVKEAFGGGARGSDGSTSNNGGAGAAGANGVVKGDQEQIDKYIANCLAVKAKYPKV